MTVLSRWSTPALALVCSDVSSCWFVRLASSLFQFALWIISENEVWRAHRCVCVSSVLSCSLFIPSPGFISAYPSLLLYFIQSRWGMLLEFAIFSIWHRCLANRVYVCECVCVLVSVCMCEGEYTTHVAMRAWLNLIINPADVSFEFLFLCLHLAVDFLHAQTCCSTQVTYILS